MSPEEMKQQHNSLLNEIRYQKWQSSWLQPSKQNISGFYLFPGKKFPEENDTNTAHISQEKGSFLLLSGHSSEGIAANTPDWGFFFNNLLMTIKRTASSSLFIMPTFYSQRRVHDLKIQSTCSPLKLLPVVSSFNFGCSSITGVQQHTIFIKP